MYAATDMPLLDISDLKMKAGWRDSQIPPDPSSKTAASKHRQNKERLKSILGSAARSMIISPAEDDEIEGEARYASISERIWNKWLIQS